MSERLHEADVAIVGGGPSGIAAALELRRRGVARVLIVEREQVLGGIPRHCAHSPFGMREFGRVMTGPAFARRLDAEARRAGIGILAGHAVTALEPGGVLALTGPEGLARIRARRILLATGTREATRAQRLLPGERPLGVMNTAALQAHVALERLRPFRAPVIVGTELVSMSAIWTCLSAGIRPVAVVEANPRPTARWPLTLFPRLKGIPLHLGAEITDIRGPGRLSGITLRTPSGPRDIACDGLVLTGRFRPEAALPLAAGLAIDAGSMGPEVDQFGRTADPLVFACGNLLRPVETGGWAFREGRAVGAAIARDLAAGLPPADAAIAVRAEGPLRLALPQRLVQGTAAPALDRFQLRMATEARGRLILGDAAGREIWAARGHWRPERRITVPLPDLSGAGADLTFRMEAA